MASSITLDELLSEFEKLGVTAFPNDEGLTCHEYSEKWGVGREKARCLLVKLRDAGVLENGWKSSTRIDGATSRVPVYRITIEEPKKRGRKK